LFELNVKLLFVAVALSFTTLKQLHVDCLSELRHKAI